jgi:hypothetical protein
MKYIKEENSLIIKSYNEWDKIKDCITMMGTESKIIIDDINGDHLILPYDYKEDTSMVASGPENRGLKG